MFTLEKLWQMVSEKIDLQEALKDFGKTYDELDEPWKKLDFVVDLLLSEKYQDYLLEYKPLSPTLAPYSDVEGTYVLGSGLKNSLDISGAINKMFGPNTSGLKILDFGCGTGRLSRFFVQYSPENDYYGCDVNPYAIDFLKQNLVGHWETMIPEPPTSYPDNFFDVIVAWSIFTHYSENLHFLWLKELKRILKPGGALLATIHSEDLLESKNIEIFQAPPDVHDSFRNHQYCYWPFYQTREDKKELGIVDEFGMAFFSHEYVMKTWPQMFKLVDIQAVVQGWQDLVVAIKPDE